jgi:uncharacterized protein YxjI
MFSRKKNMQGLSFCCKVAEVSKKWFRLHDTYGVEIEPGQDDILIPAVTVCINQMAH